MWRRMLVVFAFVVAGPVFAGTPPVRRSAVVDAVARVSPAVVNISTARVVEREVSPFAGLNDPVFDEFFRDFVEPRRQRVTRTSLGSGVIIREDGYVLTNQHVISRAAHITVVLADEREFEAQLIGADVDTDLAVLKVNSDRPLPAVTMGTSSDLLIGETVIAIGNPFGLSHTVTAGVISAIGRSLQSGDQTFYDLVQTDASINPGNSGGPLINIDGDLIGINSAIYQKAQGIGFAIPIDRAQRIVTDLISFGEVQPAWSGLIARDIAARPGRGSSRQPAAGVYVQGVETDSPATEAGIEPGDVIQSVGDRPLHSVDEWESRLRDQPIGTPLHLTVLRGDDRLALDLRTRRFPPERVDELAWRLMGMRFQEAGGHIELRAIRRDGSAARQGFRPGDVILGVSGRPVATLDDCRRRLVEVRHAQGVLLTVQRGQNLYHVTLRFDRDG